VNDVQVRYDVHLEGVRRCQWISSVGKLKSN
jgi:hypothetical protein